MKDGKRGKAGVLTGTEGVIIRRGQDTTQDAHAQTHATLKNTQTNISKQLHKQSMTERFSIGLPVGVADMHQYT